MKPADARREKLQWCFDALSAGGRLGIIDIVLTTEAREDFSLLKWQEFWEEAPIPATDYARLVCSVGFVDVMIDSEEPLGDNVCRATIRATKPALESELDTGADCAPFADPSVQPAD